MDHSASGSCLCGTVRFRIDGPFESFFLCHCARCRKDTGSAHSANLFSGSAGITWLSGQESIRTFRLPETRHAKSFCTHCGSALPMLQMDGALLVVPAGSLDSRLGMRPDARICHDDRADWIDEIEASEKIGGLPG
ncbi:GFA family protein [Frigidibacter sp. ROC022]|uniref:GFA family protein n=1 Tax=Frigidibacter sp. ROC022 TaxID=2971796 RepID=UPI00215A4A8F|nr:GFA family protein [Frigidibacter sp. ROC022]